MYFNVLEAFDIVRVTIKTKMNLPKPAIDMGMNKSEFLMVIMCYRTWCFNGRDKTCEQYRSAFKNCIRNNTNVILTSKNDHVVDELRDIVFNYF